MIFPKKMEKVLKRLKKMLNLFMKNNGSSTNLIKIEKIT